MRSAYLTSCLASIAYAAPQLIDLAAIDAAPNPVLVAAPLDVTQNIPVSSAPAPIQPITTPVTKREVIKKRDGDCSKQPAGSGPVASPDTPAAFQADPDLQVCYDT